MRRSLGVAALTLLLLLIAGCGTAGPGESTLAVPTAATATVVADLAPPTDTAIPSPTDTPADTPRPSATTVPTLPPSTATPTRTPMSGTTPSGQILAIIETIEFEMEGLRGLDGTSPVTRTLMTREELTRYLAQEFEDDYSPQEVAVDVRVLAAFNFVPEDIDLRQILLDLYSEQVLGMYDKEVDTLFVVSDGEFDLRDRLTVAHEYVHGLQDQTFGLDSFIDEDQLNDDQYLARMALIEGDATLSMTQYLLAHLRELSAEELQSLQEEDSGGQTALEAAPAIIRETLAFPYNEGTEFVTLLQERGWRAVDAAYADPPQSTEQILHPERYLERDEPQMVSLPPLTDTLGIGWERIDSETLGEFQTVLYLAQEVGQATAEQASAGWDGDRYAVYGRGEDEILALTTVWDSATDRDEFLTAYEQYTTARYGRDPSGAEDDAIWWQTPSQATALSWSAEQTFVVVGPDLATVERVLAAFAP
jgi:hypothetical protein